MKQLIATFFMFLAGASCLSASVIYSIHVDTSALNGQSGNLDFQFNPGNVDAQSATAAISGFVTNGVVGTPAVVTGDVTPANASLPGSFTLGNSGVFNDLFQPITFGSSVNFLVTLGGAAVNAPNSTSTSGSTFAFSLYDAAGINPLLTSSADGAVVDIFINPHAVVSAATFRDVAGDPPVATATLLPEPASWILMGIGAVVVGFRSRYR